MFLLAAAAGQTIAPPSRCLSAVAAAVWIARGSKLECTRGQERSSDRAIVLLESRRAMASANSKSSYSR